MPVALGVNPSLLSTALGAAFGAGLLPAEVSRPAICSISDGERDGGGGRGEPPRTPLPAAPEAPSSGGVWSRLPERVRNLIRIRSIAPELSTAVHGEDDSQPELTRDLAILRDMDTMKESAAALQFYLERNDINGSLEEFLRHAKLVREVRQMPEFRQYAAVRVEDGGLKERTLGELKTDFEEEVREIVERLWGEGGSKAEE